VLEVGLPGEIGVETIDVPAIYFLLHHGLNGLLRRVLLLLRLLLPHHSGEVEAALLGEVLHEPVWIARREVAQCEQLL
jgi:hypothetical protein